jgi:hypothetical protein
MSVSIREAEVLDRREKMLYDSFDLLQGENIFYVNGLSLEELAAEKTLGWTTKEGNYSASL